MEHSNTKDLTKDFRSSYQRYKHLSNTLVTWLVSTYEDASSHLKQKERHSKSHVNETSQNRSNVSTSPKNPAYSVNSTNSTTSVADLEHFAKLIVNSPQHGLQKVPRSILSCLYKIIQRRSEAHRYYCNQPDSDKTSNEGHSHFIGILERIFDTLGGEAWLQEQLSVREEQLRKMEKADVDATSFQSCGPSNPNRFFQITPNLTETGSISDSEDEGEEIDEWLPDQSSSSDSKPNRHRHSHTHTKKRRRSSATARRAKKRVNNLFPELQFDEDESDEMFTRFCFFDDLNMLRGHTQRIWSEWASEPSLRGLVVASTATDVAVRMAESLEQRLFCHDAILAGWSAESIRECLDSLDGMVRASEDWTISLMSPYYAVLSGSRSTATGTGNGLSDILTPYEARMIELPGFKDSVSTPMDDQQLPSGSKLPQSYSSEEFVNHSAPTDYWASLLSRMSGEITRSDHQPLLLPGESAFTHLMMEGRNNNTIISSLSTLPAIQQAQLAVVSESQEEEPVTIEDSQFKSNNIGNEIDGCETALVKAHATPVVKPSLLFAGQLYLDINEITKDIDFRYQDAVSRLGNKLYKYINWLSCHNLKKHVSAHLISPQMTLFPMDDDIPAMTDRRKFASRSLASRGVWQEGMGDFGRLVGVKIADDVEWEVGKKAVAIIRPNRDNILNPWTCGSRATYLLAEALHYGARAYNEGGMFISVAHVYNAIRELHPSLSPWPLMEACLSIHGQDVFNGNRPTKAQAQNAPPEFFYNRWRLRMGLPVSEFSKGKRNGRFVKREKGCYPGNSSVAGTQMMNPDLAAPSLVFRRPKTNMARNTEGISKDVLAVKLVSKGMHLDWDDLKSLSTTNGRTSSSSTDPGHVIKSVKERLEDDMDKMSWNLFAMEAFCQRVIERVLYSIPDKEELLDVLRDYGMVQDDILKGTRWDFKENLPVFAVLVLLFPSPSPSISRSNGASSSFYSNPLWSTWINVFEAYATEPQDENLTLLPVEAAQVVVDTEGARVEELVE